MRPTESEEWLDELVTQWTEVHKKSMVTLELLRVINTLASAHAETIASSFSESTGWTLSDRALYRTLKRLASNGLLHVEEESVPKTGAKRKTFTLSSLGVEFLNEIQNRVRSISTNGESSDSQG